MSVYRVLESASHRLDEIYLYTVDTRGEAQADAYIRGLFECFAAIAARHVPWRPIPTAFAIDGYVYRYERHYVYWKLLNDGSVGITTILHERMHQIARLQVDVGE